ncbi:MAG: S1C family serine protease [Egibacteraceae bacterium]
MSEQHGGPPPSREPVAGARSHEGWTRPVRSLPPPPSARVRPPVLHYPPIPSGPPPPRPRMGWRAALLGLVTGVIGALVGGGMVAAVAEPETLDVSVPVPVRAASAPPPSRELPAPRDGDLDRVATVAEAVLPSVVRIDVTTGGSFGLGEGNGSGVIYGADGHIVTNNHVVAEADQLEVVFADGVRKRGEVVGTDELNDLAVIKVDRSGLPAIVVGRSSRVAVGELAIAVGSPFGLEGTVTAGVVSALNRGLEVSAPSGGRLYLPSVIQTDAPINPGNSGGALVNGQGELIGINSAILTAGQPANAGVGFAIPSETMVDIAEKLIADGEVHHAFLGVSGVTVEGQQAERLGIDGGAQLETVQPGTPAAEAGLREGDVVVAAGGEPVATMESLMIEIRAHEVGEELTIDYLRGDERARVTVTLVERPQDG